MSKRYQAQLYMKNSTHNNLKRNRYNVLSKKEELLTVITSPFPRAKRVTNFLSMLLAATVTNQGG